MTDGRWWKIRESWTPSLRNKSSGYVPAMGGMKSVRARPRLPHPHYEVGKHPIATMKFFGLTFAMNKLRFFIAQRFTAANLSPCKVKPVSIRISWIADAALAITIRRGRIGRAGELCRHRVKPAKRRTGGGCRRRKGIRGSVAFASTAGRRAI
jgi:hypothetical protein